jgi:catechol 2,3-dioxygenase-like lactoylglutathione lyase family enzyme
MVFASKAGPARRRRFDAGQLIRRPHLLGFFEIRKCRAAYGGRSMIRSLQHVGLTVPDTTIARRFFETMGLEVRDAHGLVFGCVGRDQDQVRLVPGTKKGLAWACWGTQKKELPGLIQRLERAGVRFIDPPKGAEQQGVWFRDPDGVVVNLRVAAAAAQHRPGVELNNPGQRYARRARRGAPDRNIDARPRKLGHLLKFSTDINRDAAFYTELLGMKLSDRIGDDMVLFLRCGGDSDHHTLAIAHSEAPGLHHLSWEMGNLDQLQLCAERMIGAGYKDGWGIGRHIYGSNYFHYVRDPWMGLHEFFWDIDFIPETAAWDVEVAEAGPESLSQWATTPAPADFLTNYETAS